MTHPSEALALGLVDALIGAGVRDVVYCPGSRSAPIAYALARRCDEGVVRAHVRLDERSAAFLAIGLSRAGLPVEPGEGLEPAPVAVVTTSGGAVAELHAGVAEAHHSRLPLIVVSADRPAEMRGVGASQTTAQVGVFAAHTRPPLDLPTDTTPGRALAARIAREVASARGLPSGQPGPVHINVAFRDPLTPEGGSAGAAPVPFGAAGAPTRIERARITPVAWEEAVDPDLATVIIAGDSADSAASQWAERAAVPLLAEPSSGVRFASSAFDHQQTLLVSELGAQIRQVVVTGRPTLSRPVSALLARDDVRIVIVDAQPTWADVAGRAALVLPALASAADPASDVTWLERWREAESRAGARIDEILADAPRSVLAVARDVWEADGRTLLLGASNSVRAADLVARAGADPRRVISNRGLAGIDGTIATAIGVAAGSGEPVTALLGDLAFFHDAGALALPVGEPVPDVVLVVADDAGGGVFATLEHGRAENEPTFERWFATAQPTSVEGIASAYGARYVRAEDGAELRAVLVRSPEGIVVCHVPCVRPEEIADVRNALL